MKDMPERVFIEKKGKRKFRDFSDVLSLFYKDRTSWHLADKKHLRTILESRNNIVHKGKYKEWDDDLADYIISCVFLFKET